MANAIPLSAPDGTVYAYACGTCHHVASAGECLVPHDADTIAELAEGGRIQAEACCRCQRYSARQSFEFMADHVCAACLPAYEAEHAERDARYAAEAARRAGIQAERMRASADPVAAGLLAELMRNIGEGSEFICAEWPTGLEFSLWPMVIGLADRHFGMGEVGEVSKPEVAELRLLHKRCGGWMRWEKDVGEVFVPTADWERIYTDYLDRFATGEPT